MADKIADSDLNFDDLQRVLIEFGKKGLFVILSMTQIESKQESQELRKHHEFTPTILT